MEGVREGVEGGCRWKGKTSSIVPEELKNLHTLVLASHLTTTFQPFTSEKYFIYTKIPIVYILLSENIFFF